MNDDREWWVHRRPGARRVAVHNRYWKKAMYLTPDDAKDLMTQLAAALNVEPPEVEWTGRCEAVKIVGEQEFRCMADAGRGHWYPSHYYRDGDVQLRWNDEDRD